MESFLLYFVLSLPLIQETSVPAQEDGGLVNSPTYIQITNP